MVHCRGRKLLFRPAVSLAFITVAGGLIWASAGAEALSVTRSSSVALIGGDGHGHGGRIKIHSGNGKFNKNYSTVLSPTVNRGFQQVSNTNVSGKTTTLVGICAKKHRICKISQRSH